MKKLRLMFRWTFVFVLLGMLHVHANAYRQNRQQVTLSMKAVSLKDVLPEDMKLTSGTSEDVWVKVSILPIGSHSYGLPSNQITVDNLADNLLVTFGTDKIEIRVKATDGELDDFNLDEVKASVDLKDMGVGSYQIPVTVKLPKGFELLDDVVADVTISEVSNSDTNNE